LGKRALPSSVKFAESDAIPSNVSPISINGVSSVYWRIGGVMSGGLKTTFDLLAATKNEVASDLLLETLESVRSDIKFTALSAVTKRRSSRLHDELLRRWHTLSERAKAVLVDSAPRLTRAV